MSVISWISLVTALVLTQPADTPNGRRRPANHRPHRHHHYRQPWVRAPRVRYPGWAADEDVAFGWADVRCHVLDTGLLEHCVVAREGPEGYGFGREAVRAMSAALLSPEMGGETVRQRLTFRLAD